MSIVEPHRQKDLRKRVRKGVVSQAARCRPPVKTNQSQIKRALINKTAHSDYLFTLLHFYAFKSVVFFTNNDTNIGYFSPISRIFLSFFTNRQFKNHPFCEYSMFKNTATPTIGNLLHFSTNYACFTQSDAPECPSASLLLLKAI